jgi:hypothetical protein
MALFLTSGGVLARAHHMIERSKPIRTGALTAAAGAAGLAMGKTRTGGKKAPIVALAGGIGLSFLGFTGIGDGVAGAGATLLGYKLGVRSRRKALQAQAAAASPAGPAATPGLRKVVLRRK